MDDDMGILSPGYVSIEGARIAHVAPGDPPEDVWRRAHWSLDAAGQVVMPGLINGHTHLYQSFLKGLNDTLDLVDWCDEVLFPSADVLHVMDWDEKDQSAGYYYALLGAIEMIRGGITCCVDMDIVMDTVFEAWETIGIRGIGAITLSDQWLPRKLQQTPDDLRQNTLHFVHRWHRTPTDEPLIYVTLAPSGPYLASRDLLDWTREQAELHDLGIQIHVAETRWEVETIKRETGLHPVAYLDSVGFLDGRVSAVHCVHVGAEEIDTLRRRDVSVVHNPKSNLKLGSGIAPVPDMLAAGITVALGTDGAASNDLLDLWEEMRAAALIHKGVAENPGAISATDVLRMATVDGARAFGLDAGVLASGRLADVITVALDRPHTLPVHDPLNTLVYCARADDVQTVFVNGRLIMDQRRLLTISEDEIVAEAVAMGEHIYRRSQESPLCRR
jgi:5-methylthioadenosine/S-adenosylhomocysteine deaminase